MKHPFQVGDLVLSRSISLVEGRRALAIVTKTHISSNYGIDVFYLRTGEVLSRCRTTWFTLVSRAEG
jgi:hypothetical protein